MASSPTSRRPKPPAVNQSLISQSTPTSLHSPQNIIPTHTTAQNQDEIISSTLASPTQITSTPAISRARPAPSPATSGKKRKMEPSTSAQDPFVDPGGPSQPAEAAAESSSGPPAKKTRTNTPWTPAEEKRLKELRDAGTSWSEIAKTFPNRTEGSVKKHWYKDMHYAEFAEDESAALLEAIKEYDAQKWKIIGQKVGKPAKACEQYARDHFAGRI